MIHAFILLYLNPFFNVIKLPTFPSSEGLPFSEITCFFLPFYCEVMEYEEVVRGPFFLS